MLRRFLHRSLLVGAGIIAAPDDGVRVDGPSSEEIGQPADSEPSEERSGHVAMTRAIDVVCPACGGIL